MTVRLADPRRDAREVAGIYRPIVEETHTSFEETAPSPLDMERRIARTLERTPWLVAEVGASVVGYAYATSHRNRPAYRWSLDISVYVGAASRGQGVGRLLCEELLTRLRRQGFVNAYAGIALPNPASEALHRSLGMRRLGVHEKVGYKLGRWWDVAWYGMRLIDPPDEPDEPVPLPRL